METTINGINYTKTRVYRVYYNNGQDWYNAFFESKASAEAFAALVDGVCGIWSWNAWVEK
jgi:hypothetical protein